MRVLLASTVCATWVLQLTKGSPLSLDSYWQALLNNSIENYVPHGDNLHNGSNARQFFVESDLQRMRESVNVFLSFPGERVWQVVPEVSEQRPLILFHQRKAGGSSLRETLYAATKALNITSFIPCKDNVSCDSYTFPRDKPFAVYAGHFKWGAQFDLAKFNQTLRKSYSCLTNYRHPLSRIESCIYYRFGRILKGRCLADLSDEEFLDLFHKTDEYGTSCLNEPFRALSGISDEIVLDSLVPTDRHGRVDEDELSWRRRKLIQSNSSFSPALLSSLSLDLLNLTLRHTLRCTPIILELPQTYDLASERWPILGKNHAFLSNVQFKKRSIGKKCAKLSGDRLRVVEREAALEMILYDAVLRKTAMRVRERFPDFAFHLQCSSLSAARDYLPLESVRRTPIAIVSTDGAAVRLLIEHASGLLTGSLRSKHLSTFPGDNHCGKRMIAIYAEIGSFHVRPVNSTAQLHYLPSIAAKRCRNEMITHFTEAVVHLKDPFFELWKALRVTNSSKEEEQFLSQWKPLPLNSHTRSLLQHIHSQTDDKKNNSARRNDSVLRGNRLETSLKIATEEREIHVEAANRPNKIREKQTHAHISHKAGERNSTLLHHKGSTKGQRRDVDLEVEKEFFHRYFSLLMDFHTYSSLFSSYLPVFQSSPTMHQEDIPLSKLFASSSKVPSFPKEKFLFFSLEAVSEAARDISLFAQKTSSVNSTGHLVFSQSYKQRFTTENNAFLRLLHFSHGLNHATPTSVHCAFSHVQAAHYNVGAAKQKEITEMRRYYSARPALLQKLKALVRERLVTLNLSPEQMLYLYKLY